MKFKFKKKQKKTYTIILNEDEAVGLMAILGPVTDNKFRELATVARYQCSARFDVERLIKKEFVFKLFKCLKYEGELNSGQNRIK